MDVKGANPFLFTDDDYTSPQSTTSNPFLIEADYQDCSSGGTNDNPFLTEDSTATTTSAFTNPFAFDPEELSDNSQIPPSQPDFINTSQPDFINTSQPDFINTSQPHYTTNVFNSTSANQNLFGTETITSTAPTNQNFFMNPTPPEQDFLTNGIVTSTGIQKPTDLDLKYTNTTASSSDEQNTTQPGLPPRLPPSKETQDLLMSVMGAMDATSSHLLNRIPPTRSPSPVSIRDLHSPSPTPEPVGDLLDVSDSKPVENEAQNTNISNEPDLLSLDQDTTCDINQNPPLTQINNEVAPPKPPPARPAPPSRPPRPLPPQKPPPPNIIQQQPQPVQPTQQPQSQQPPAPGVNPTIPAVTSKPPPPNALSNSNQNQKDTAQDDFDMFGVEPPKTVASKADILNLYNAQPKQEKPDLLFDVMETEVTPKEQTNQMMEEDLFGSAQNVEVSVEETKEDESPFQAQETPVIQENILNLSHEHSQSDLQMDTSDSQSKGSVSSVTFNPFAASEDTTTTKQNDVFSQDTPLIDNNVFSADVPDNTTVKQDPFGDTTISNQDAFNAPIINTAPPEDAFSFGTKNDDEFDAFAQKFDAVSDENKNGGFDAFSDGINVWGSTGPVDAGGGFGADDSFDAFLALQEPPSVPQSTPNRISKQASQESDEEKDFSVFIRPKGNEDYSGGVMPTIAPPPAVVQSAFTDNSPKLNPFEEQNSFVTPAITQETVQPFSGEFTRTDSQETPPTPLFDEDVSQPLEPFPRIHFAEDGWEMHLRQPNKKKITGQRFWKKIFVRLVTQSDCVLLQLFNQANDKDPFQELPLQPCYSVSDIGAQQYDQFGKIFTLKLQYIFYKERPGVRPGQVKKAERITNKLSQFAAYAIQGDYQGVKEFGSDLKKLGLPVEHSPQVSQLMKLGSLNYEDLKQFSVCIEESLFKLSAHRDRALHYKMEEVQITAVDELYAEQDADGHIIRQIARVRLFFLGFLTGMPDIELGINDMRRQGKEVVGRHDIIPVVTEEWIRLEVVEFHSCVQQDVYGETHIIKFKPPDACYIELLRFRVRPPRNRELPLQLKATICILGNKVELRADVLVPGFASRKLGQIPCEDVMIRFPIPECWIYLFRVEKHFRYGSVKSAHRRTGKIKGIERILGTCETLQESLIEVTSGQAKYEHQHRAIVWRCPRLPKEGQGAYTTHNMVCKLALTSYDQMPDKLAEYCYVEFTMPATQVSHTTVRSVSVQNSDSDEPPEKYVRYLARHEYRVGIDHIEGEPSNPYEVATAVKPPPPPPVQEKPAPVPEEESSSDSD